MKYHDRQMTALGLFLLTWWWYSPAIYVDFIPKRSCEIGQIIQIQVNPELESDEFLEIYVKLENDLIEIFSTLQPDSHKVSVGDYIKFCSGGGKKPTIEKLSSLIQV